MRQLRVYAEWMAYFDELENAPCDVQLLTPAKTGTLPLSQEVAARFIKRIFALVEYRMKRNEASFDRIMQFATDEYSYSQALLGMKKEFTFLKKLVRIPVLPEEYQTQLVQDVQEVADNTQQSLESSAQSRDRSGVLAHLVRSNKVNG
ncbi:hypothetical protein [uncultured Veillonella sp.]|uniref:hypothetical protein n=1 Tax=uncultured Veillonella sp. TaxID=159268 RepID=UPI00262A9882|nr:hypothetical protein [uncultured Veillonella sp.]